MHHSAQSVDMWTFVHPVPYVHLLASLVTFSAQDIIHILCNVHFCVPFIVYVLKTVHLCIHCIAR